ICCSGVVVVLFLVFYFLRLSWSSLLFGSGLLLVGAFALSLFLPAILASLLYGSQPGLVVIFLIMAVHWLWQERYRRQIVFIPGFARLKTGSSLIRGSSAPRASRPREASTVDSPASSSVHPAGASISQK